MSGYEVMKRVLSFLYIMFAVVCEYLVLRKFPLVYGQTVKYYMLVGMGVAVGYIVLVHLYREMVSCRKAQLTGIYSIGSCAFSLLCLYFMKYNLLAEDTCFFAIVLSLIFVMECSKPGTLIEDVQCARCKMARRWNGRKTKDLSAMLSLGELDEKTQEEKVRGENKRKFIDLAEKLRVDEEDEKPQEEKKTYVTEEGIEIEKEDKVEEVEKPVDSVDSPEVENS